VKIASQWRFRKDGIDEWLAEDKKFSPAKENKVFSFHLSKKRAWNFLIFAKI